MTDYSRSTDRPVRRMTLLNGGWIFLLLGCMMLGVVVWRVSAWVNAQGSHAIGDGRDASTYGFTLSPCLVDRDTLYGANIPKDGVQALLDPGVLTFEQVLTPPEDPHQPKYLVHNDRVIGVVLNGEVRAYPLKEVQWYEVVNDVLGGVPIAVTYHPLSRSVVVFDRRVGGEVAAFRHSGLLYNSTHVLYDDRAVDAEESLWSPVQGRAIAGPRAGTLLDILPAQVVSLRAWLGRHPDTTVMARDEIKAPGRNREPYQTYFANETLRFPVSPLPPDGQQRKALLLALNIDGVWLPVFFETVVLNCDEQGLWRTTLHGRDVVFRYDPSPGTVSATLADGSTPPAIYCYWFAWYALRQAPAAN